MASNRPELEYVHYLQGILENLSRQENLRVKRFTLIETFLMEVNVKVSNFYQLIFEYIPWIRGIWNGLYICFSIFFFIYSNIFQ